MKGIIKSNGKVVNIIKTQEVEGTEGKRMMHITNDGHCYDPDDMDTFFDDFAYWRDLRHDVAATVLAGLVQNTHYTSYKAKKAEKDDKLFTASIVSDAIEFTDKLIEELQKTQFDKLNKIKKNE